MNKVLYIILISIFSLTVFSCSDKEESSSSSGPYWELIAKQADSDVQLFSSNARSTFLENENDPSQSTFMSIGNLEKSNYADTDEKYKFKLVWGGEQVDSEGIPKEVTWTQTSWLEDSTIQGFQEIGTSGYVTGDTDNGFFSLGKSSQSECVIDGNGGTDQWWNCAGATSLHSYGGSTGMPGPMRKIASSMYLYIWESGTNSG